MTDAFTPAANSTLASVSVPLAVVTDNDVVSLSVSYGPLMVTETVFQQGLFFYPYLRSTQSGARSFSIVRDGGWPQAPKFWVNDPLPSSGNATNDPLTISAVGAWNTYSDALNEQIRGFDYAAGHHTLLYNRLTFPDYVSGQTAYIGCTTDSGASSNDGLTLSAYVSALNILGECTFTARVCRLRCPNSSTVYQYFYAHGNYDLTGNSAGNATFACGIAQNSSALFAYWESGTHTGTTVLSTTTLGDMLKDGKWHYVSVRRTAANRVIFGVDGTFETSSTFANYPTDGSNGRVCIGKPPTNSIAGNAGLLGSVMNPVIRNVSLTDAQVLATRATVMGL